MEWAECFLKDKVDIIKEELADVFIYSVLLADACNLNFDEIVFEKLKRNEGKHPIEKAFGNPTKYTNNKGNQ